MNTVSCSSLKNEVSNRDKSNDHHNVFDDNNDEKFNLLFQKVRFFSILVAI